MGVVLTQEGDGATYIIALQHGTGLQELDPPPVLPSNARFVNHPNHCFDIGTVAWVMDNHVPDPRWAHHLVHGHRCINGLTYIVWPASTARCRAGCWHMLHDKTTASW